MALTFSYARWSTPKQEQGGTYDRQVEAYDKFMARHPALTPAQTRYIDKGRTARKGANWDPKGPGHLRRFIEGVKRGVIPRDSWLVVESLDRMSRVKPHIGRKLIDEVIELGITIQTLSPEHTLNLKTIDGDWTKLSFIDILLDKATQETEDRAERSRDGFAKKVAKWTDPTPEDLRGRKVISPRCPAWLAPNATDTGWVKLPDKVKVVRELFALSLRGHGCPVIARKLNRKGLRTLDRGVDWSVRSVHKLLTNRNVLGYRTSNNGHPEIANYYPVIVKPETFYAVQDAMAKRRFIGGGPPSDRHAVNLLAGIAYCRCGAKMRVVSVARGYLYLQCRHRYADLVCEQPTLPYFPLEGLVLGYLARHLPKALAAKVVVADDPTESLRARRDDLKKRLDRWYEAFVDEGSPPDEVLRGKINKVRDELRGLEDQIQSALIVSVQRDALEDASRLIAKLDPTTLEKLTREERLTLREAIRQVCQRVTCWTADHDTGQLIYADQRYVDIKLRAQIRSAEPQEPLRYDDLTSLALWAAVRRDKRRRGAVES